MKTSFTIDGPAVVSGYGLLDVCTKLAIALDKTMQSVFEIGGVDRVHVHTFYDDSSHPYTHEFGSPLKLICRIANELGETVTRLYARLYFNRETNEAWAWVHGASREKFRGDLDTVVKSLSTAILKQLQARSPDTISG